MYSILLKGTAARQLGYSVSETAPAHLHMAALLIHVQVLSHHSLINGMLPKLKHHGITAPSMGVCTVSLCEDMNVSEIRGFPSPHTETKNLTLLIFIYIFNEGIKTTRLTRIVPLNSA